MIIESLPFETTLNLPPPESPEPSAKPVPAPHRMPGALAWLGKNSIWAGLALAALVALAASLLLLRRRAGQRPGVEIRAALPGGAETPSLEAPHEQAAQKLEAQLAEQAARREQLEAEALNALKLPPVKTKKAEILAKHLAEAVKKDPAATAQILRSWLYELEK